MLLWLQIFGETVYMQMIKGCEHNDLVLKKTPDPELLSLVKR